MVHAKRIKDILLHDLDKEHRGLIMNAYQKDPQKFDACCQGLQDAVAEVSVSQGRGR